MNSISYFYFKTKRHSAIPPLFYASYFLVEVPKIPGTRLMRGYDILRPIVSSLERAQLVLSSYGFIN